MLVPSSTLGLAADGPRLDQHLVDQRGFAGGAVAAEDNVADVRHFRVCHSNILMGCRLFRRFVLPEREGSRPMERQSLALGCTSTAWPAAATGLVPSYSLRPRAGLLFRHDGPRAAERAAGNEKRPS